jgi:hypothetical protein
VLLVDSRTSEADQQKIAKLAGSRASIFLTDKMHQFSPGGAVRLEIVKDAVASVRDPIADILLTSRLDSDDAIHEDAMGLVRQKAEEVGPGFFVDLQHGLYVRANGSCMRRVGWTGKAASPFVSLVEDAQKPRTVYCKSHSNVGKKMPIARIARKDMWIQVIHGRNVGTFMGRQPTEKVVIPSGFHVACKPKV